MAFPTNEAIERMVEPVARTYGMDIEKIRTVKAGKKSQVVIALDLDGDAKTDLEIAVLETGLLAASDFVL